MPCQALDLLCWLVSAWQRMGCKLHLVKCRSKFAPKLCCHSSRCCLASKMIGDTLKVKGLQLSPAQEENCSCYLWSSGHPTRMWWKKCSMSGVIKVSISHSCPTPSSAQTSASPWKGLAGAGMFWAACLLVNLYLLTGWICGAACGAVCF